MVPSFDAKTFTITIRPGVKFHDGTPLDGKAVAMTLEANIKSPQNGPALFNVANVSQSGPMTVTVTCKEAWPAFPCYLSGAIGTIMSPTMLAEPNGGNLKPIGTGPARTVPDSVQLGPRINRPVSILSKAHDPPGG